jgi:uncharacterized protein YegP (UPF0339 family)
MLLQPTLSAVPEIDPAFDQQRLFAIGLEHARSLSRRLWTDHNIHDPGITTLELLAYALTDLSYRANFPLEDLLASVTEGSEAQAPAFASARRILPGRPVTTNEYRKLLIDLHGIRNAWIEPFDLRYFVDTEGGVQEDAPEGSELSFKVRGLYQVLVEYDGKVTSDKAKNTINTKVLATLHANRGLGDDFAGVNVIETQQLSLCAKIELTAEADVDQIAARIAFDVDRFLAPPVVPCRLAEMLERRNPDGTLRTAPEIFTGPLLTHGFIDGADLAASELRSEVHLSDIVSIIMKIPGVLAIRTIAINALDPGTGNAVAPDDKWRLPILKGYRPRLSVDKTHLSFSKRNALVLPAVEKVKPLFEALQNEEQQKLKSPVDDDLHFPSGRKRSIADYQSFQAHFPDIYGLSERGLPPGATPLRAAQALQLKAYLLFFDQVMANYLALLAQVRDLFSLDPDLGHRYCTQLVNSFPDYEKIYAEDMSSSNRLSEFIETETKTASDGWKRRNRILDHLLARYAEEFGDYVQIMQSRFGSNDATLAKEITETKCAFLEEYPELGAERGLACNLPPKSKKSQWNSSNTSGFERRIARLLGTPNINRRNLSLSKAVYNTYATSGNTFNFRLRHPASRKILLSSTKHYASEAAARDEMEKVLRRARMPQGYERKIAKNGRYYFNVVADSGKTIARRIQYFTSKAACEAAIDELISYLCSRNDEGLYVIEHILLRPFIPVCPDLCAVDCSAADPYSYRLSVILPAYAGRFRDMDFRRFAEETLRREMPAHLLARICWVNSDDMADIEEAYCKWLAIRVGSANPNEQEEKTSALINALSKARNVYPGARLQAEPPFILGRTALGSADNQH